MDRAWLYIRKTRKNRKNQHQAGKILPGAVWSFPLVSAYGSRFGSLVKREDSSEYCKWKSKEKFLISCEIRNVLVETAGLEPVTSCVWRYVGTSKPCYWVLSGTFSPAFCGYKSLPCPLCPLADFLILVSVLVKGPSPPNQAEMGLFLESKHCYRDSSLNPSDCQVPLSDSGNLSCTTPTPSDGGEVYKQGER